MRARVRLPFLAFLFLIAASPALAQPEISLPGVWPTSVTAGTATEVRITARIYARGSTLVDGGVSVVRVDAAGRTLATLGTLNDAGVDGDHTADDGLFTGTILLSAPTPGLNYLRVSAAFRGILRRTLSPLVVVEALSPEVPVAVSQSNLDTAIVDPETGAAVLCDEILIDVRPGTVYELIAEAASAVAGEIVGVLPGSTEEETTTYQVRVPCATATSDLQHSIHILKASPTVVSAHVNGLVSPFQLTFPGGINVDPGPERWRQEDIYRVVQLDAAWGLDVTRAFTPSPADRRRIAVIERDMPDYCHPDLGGRPTCTVDNRDTTVILGSNHEFNQELHHGTAVAGVARAIAYNGLDLVGASPGSDLVVFSAATCLQVMSSIEQAWKDHGAHVINMSFGMSQPWYCSDAKLRTAAKHSILVAAAGNERCHEDSLPLPAAHQDVLAVGATDLNDDLWAEKPNAYCQPDAGGSNFGVWVELFAPGRSIPVLLSGGSGSRSGTSYAAPLVSGIAAYVWSFNTDLTPAEVKSILRSTADVFEYRDDRDDTLYIGRRVNALRAACHIIGGCDERVSAPYLLSPHALSRPRQEACSQTGARRIANFRWTPSSSPSGMTTYEFLVWRAGETGAPLVHETSLTQTSYSLTSTCLEVLDEQTRRNWRWKVRATDSVRAFDSGDSYIGTFDFGPCIRSDGRPCPTPVPAPAVLSNPRVCRAPATGASTCPSPLTGATGDSFVYFVDYLDPKGHPPTSARLNVRVDTLGGPVAFYYPMVLEPGTGSYRALVDGLPTGTHAFYFEFENGVDPTLTTEVRTGPVVLASSSGTGALSVVANPGVVSFGQCTVITATLRDGAQQPIAGETLTFSTIFPGTLSGGTPPGCSGPSFGGGTSGVTDAQGTVKRYFKPSMSGLALVTAESASGARGSVSVSAVVPTGNVSGNLWVEPYDQGVWLLRAVLTSGGTPLAGARVSVTTSSGEICDTSGRQESCYGQSYVVTLGDAGNIDYRLELRVPQCPGNVLVRLRYAAEDYETGTTFSCVAPGGVARAPLFRVKTLDVASPLSSVTTLSWARDGSRLFASSASGSSGSVSAWNSADWTLASTYVNLYNPPMSSAVRHDGARLAVGERGGGVQVFDANLVPQLTGDPRDFSSDVYGLDWVGTNVMTLVRNATATGNYGVWRVQENGVTALIRNFPGDAKGRARLRHHVGKGLFAYGITGDGGDATVYVHQAAMPSNVSTKTLFTDNTRLNDIAWSHMGDYLAVVGAYDGVVVLTVPGLNAFQLHLPTMKFDRAEYLGTTGLLAAIRNDGRLWFLDHSGSRFEGPELPTTALSIEWNESRQLLAVGLANGQVWLLGLDNEAPIVSDVQVAPAEFDGRRQRISAVVTDGGSGVDPAKVLAVIRAFNDEVVAQVPMAPTPEGLFSAEWTVPSGLTACCFVGVYAEDRAGNAAEVRRAHLIDVGGIDLVIAPSSVTSAQMSDTTVLLRWVDNSYNEDGFRVERSLNGTSWVIAAVTGPNVTEAQVDGLQVGAWHYFRIAAFNMYSEAYSTVLARWLPAGDEDPIGPSLLITSHTQGQVVYTPTITLAGTATDEGRGDNGISQVTVNDVRAVDDQAEGAGVAHWSASVDLSSGENTLVVEAADGRGNATGVQLRLVLEPPPPDARIEGTVTNAAGDPLANMAVQIYTGEAGQTFSGIRFQVPGSYMTTVGTDSLGRYVLRGLEAGRYYVRTAYSYIQGYIDELFDDITCAFGNCVVTTGTPVQAATESPVPADFALTRGGSISGRVTDVRGAPVMTGVAVFDSLGRQLVARGVDASGNYFIGGLQSGGYYVAAAGLFNRGFNYVGQLYGGGICPYWQCDVTSGTLVQVTLGHSAAGIDLTLQDGSIITGTVLRGDSGEPLGAAVVILFNAAGGYLNNSSTDASGNYSFYGVPAGVWFLRTWNGHAWGLVNRLFDDIPCGTGCVVTSGTPVPTVAGSETPNINFVLRPQ